MTTMFRALYDRSFALVWGGQTISRVGDSLYQIALAWWVLEKTGSASAMGTFLVFSSVPLLIFLLVGGVAVDRFSRIQVMMISDALRAVIVAIIATLVWRNQLELWHVYLFSIIFGFVRAFFQPAYQAIIPDIVPKDTFSSANSLTSLSGQLAGIGGPAIGALVVATGGTALTFALNALSFAVAALCLIGVPASAASERPVAARKGVLHDLREGLTLVFQSPWLWITIVLAALVNVTSGSPIAVTLPFLVERHLHADVAVLGYFFSLLSLGSVLAALVMGYVSHWRRRGLVAYLGLWFSGLALLVMGLPVGVVGVGIAIFVYGASMSVFGLIWVNTLQELVPLNMMGRVSSVDMLGSFVLLPIGYGLTGWLTDLVGPATVFVMGGVLTMILIGLGLLHPAIRNLE